MATMTATHGPTLPPKSPTKSTKSNKSNPRSSTEPNVLEVVFGSLLIKPWYPSFYPEELVGRRVERLMVCQWCFKYTVELLPFLKHLKCCSWRQGIPPGERIYTKDGYSLWEIDGEEFKLYAQNLSLFAKLFLDTKSVFYDVTTFLYYLLVANDPVPAITTTSLSDPEPTSAPSHIIDQLQAAAAGEAPDERGGSIEGNSGGQVVGFFSKEKMSWDNNNLACILVFPPWQKQGLGQILMGASYEMSKREGRLGGPEKPLSDLGHLAYKHYWSATLARTILAASSKRILTAVDLRDETYIVPEDIIATLQEMDVLEHRKRGGAEAVINKAAVRRWMEANKVRMQGPVDPEGFVQQVDDEEGGEAMESEE